MNTPILDSINAGVDEPSVAAYLPAAQASALITLAGGSYSGKFVFGDGFACWTNDEALRYALEILAQGVSPVIPEAAQFALGELGEAQMKDGEACSFHIERACQHLRGTVPVQA